MRERKKPAEGSGEKLHSSRKPRVVLLGRQKETNMTCQPSYWVIFLFIFNKHDVVMHGTDLPETDYSKIVRFFLNLKWTFWTMVSRKREKLTEKILIKKTHKYENN